MSGTDVLVIVPLVPALVVRVLLFLPWEDWIPMMFPKWVIGLYFLYGGFVATYFQEPAWAVALPTAVGLWISIAGLVEERRRPKNLPSEPAHVPKVCPGCGMPQQWELWRRCPCGHDFGSIEPVQKATGGGNG